MPFVRLVSCISLIFLLPTLFALEAITVHCNALKKQTLLNNGITWAALEEKTRSLSNILSYQDELTTFFFKNRLLCGLQNSDINLYDFDGCEVTYI